MESCHLDLRLKSVHGYDTVTPESGFFREQALLLDPRVAYRHGNKKIEYLWPFSFNSDLRIIRSCPSFDTPPNGLKGVAGNC